MPIGLAPNNGEQNKTANKKAREELRIENKVGWGKQADEVLLSPSLQQIATFCTNE